MQFLIYRYMHEKRGQNMKGLKNNLLTYRQWLLSLRGCALQGLYALSISDWDQANVYCFYGIRVIINCFYGNANINFSVSTGSCILFVWQQVMFTVSMVTG